MIKPIINKLNTFINESGGYKGFLIIVVVIIILGVALMMLQKYWVKKEWNALKTEIEKQERKDSRPGLKAKANAKAGGSGLSFEPEESLASEDADFKKRTKDQAGFEKNQRKTASRVDNLIRNGDLHFEYHQYSEAAYLYEKLTNEKSVFKNSDKVLSRLAECYFNLEDYDSASKTYRKINNEYFNSPFRLGAQLGLGKSLVLLGNYSEARRILYTLVGQEALYKEVEDQEKIIDAYYNIADSYIKQAKENIDKGLVN